MSTTIDSLYSSATTTTTSSTSSTSSSNELGKEAFLEMLITQLQNQDPLNPMDGTEFAAQLAQFSSLEQLQNLNNTMSSLPDYLSSFSNAQVANLIGNEATASGNVVQVSGSSAAITYELPSNIQSGTISIYNSNGLLVDTLDIGSQSSGIQNTTWDCSGQSAGNYTYEISAKDSSGNAVTVNPLVTGTVTGVTFKDNVSYLTINGEEVAFSDVISITGAKN